MVDQGGDNLKAKIALDPAGTEGVHPERWRKLAREGARFTAQHLRTLSPCVATRPWSQRCSTRSRA
jgi:hypothetical protein